MGERPNGSLLEKTERKLKSSLGAPRITEQPRRHGSSARCVRGSMTQGYWPGVEHVAWLRRSGSMERSALDVPTEVYKSFV